MSGRNRILTYVRENPGKTAGKIAQALNLKLPTVSSYLNAQVKDGVLRRLGKQGPRGGYAYYFPAPKPVRESRWKRLTNDEPVMPSKFDFELKISMTSKSMSHPRNVAAALTRVAKELSEAFPLSYVLEDTNGLVHDIRGKPIGKWEIKTRA